MGCCLSRQPLSQESSTSWIDSNQEDHPEYLEAATAEARLASQMSLVPVVDMPSFAPVPTTQNDSVVEHARPAQPGTVLEPTRPTCQSAAGFSDPSDNSESIVDTFETAEFNEMLAEEVAASEMPVEGSERGSLETGNVRPKGVVSYHPRTPY